MPLCWWASPLLLLAPLLALALVEASTSTGLARGVGARACRKVR